MTAPMRPEVAPGWIRDHGTWIKGWVVLFEPTDPHESGMHPCRTRWTAMRRARRIAIKQQRRAEA
jgi:hypothetical protein